jgi:hypothetical protein
LRHLFLALLVACAAPPPSEPVAPADAAPHIVAEEVAIVVEPQPQDAAPNDTPQPSDAPPPPPSDEAPPLPPPAPGSVPDGGPCLDAANCASGICEGQGCDEALPGICAPRMRPCTRDLRAFCGCDGLTFRSSSSCVGRRYAAAGPCG